MTDASITPAASAQASTTPESATQPATPEAATATPAAPIPARLPNTPESSATVAHIGAVVYFSSASENTARFIKNCRLPEAGLNVYRIPLRPKDGPLVVDDDRGNRRLLRGVIASGNTNFGDAFCAAGDVIAAKCHVPFLYSFELTGTPEDMRKVREGLRDFFLRLSDGRTV